MSYFCRLPQVSTLQPKLVEALYYIELRECMLPWRFPVLFERLSSLFAVPAEQQAVPQRAGLRERTSSRRCREIQQVGLHHRVPTPSPFPLM
jgi:hypothetical protein